jgi:hypothetical protein
MPDNQSTPIEPILPNLDRKEIVDRKSGSNYLDWDAYGTYVFAVRHLRFDPGTKKNPHYKAHVVVVQSDNPNYPAGRETCLHFPVGRTGTATDPDRPDRDDRMIDDFIRSIFKKARGDASFKATAAFQALVAKGRVDHNEFQFRFIRKPGNTRAVVDQKTRQINDVTYPKDKFEAA